MIVGMIKVYQLVASPFPSSCRYSPSCSTYMLEAVRRHGALKGTWLGIKRLGRCHPFGGSGFDPVP
jgi:putative membrane protein insertion efficiency factor